ncbi:B-box zinc finger protein [Candidatus Poribacteria bacterium]|nr:B-box zinc finger protein [Candidatus Poribacteria bacterium]
MAVNVIAFCLSGFSHHADMTGKRYCINHPESMAPFYCAKCKLFLCAECVGEDFKEDGGFAERCPNCAGQCIPSKGIVPANITVVPKSKGLGLPNRLLCLIVNPAETVDRLLGSLSWKMFLTVLLPAYLLSLILANWGKSSSFYSLISERAVPQIALAVTFVLAIEAICRLVGALLAGEEERIKGWVSILGMTAGTAFLNTILNIWSFLTGFLPPYPVKALLSFGIGMWVCCAYGFFINAIYDIELVPALIISLLALSVAISIYVRLFLFR